MPSACARLQNERTITYLAPNASPMPGRYLVAGSIKWIDDN